MGPIIEQVDPGDMEREREGRERGEGERGRRGREGERGGKREREGERGRDSKCYTLDSSYCIQVNVETETDNTHLFPSWTHPAMSLMGMCSRFSLVLV